MSKRISVSGNNIPISVTRMGSSFVAEGNCSARGCQHSESFTATANQSAVIGITRAFEQHWKQDHS